MSKQVKSSKALVVCKIDEKNAKRGGKEISFNNREKVGKSDHTVLHEYCALARGFLSQRKVTLMKKAEFERKYVGVEKDGTTATPLDDALKLSEMQLKIVKEAAAMSFGQKTVKAVLPVIYAATSAVVTGLLQNVQGIRPETTNEFTTFASLFDEYRCVGFRFHFNNLMAAQTVDNSGDLSRYSLGIGFDPADPTTAASLDTIIQLTKHQLYMTTQSAANATATAHHGQPWKFEASIPHGVLIPNGAVAGAGVGSDVWQATAPFGPATYLAYGFLKFFSQSGPAAASKPLVGVLYLDCEFRMRN
jgi:hypothetical protein